MNPSTDISASPSPHFLQAHLNWKILAAFIKRHHPPPMPIREVLIQARFNDDIVSLNRLFQQALVQVFFRHKLADVTKLSGVKVMVIDDSNTIRRSAEMFLVQAGYQVVLAEDGFDALAKIADHQPAVIFCDIMMPRLDGYQTCALIKKNKHFCNTPLIMLSSKESLFDQARGRLVGSDDYLTKPFTQDGLLQVVAKFSPPTA